LTKGKNCYMNWYKEKILGMKKMCFLLLLAILCSFYVFGDNDDQEELGYLLFLPNSSNLFVDEVQAQHQLDNLAKDFLNKNLENGQIYVYGYAAYSDIVVDIDPKKLSEDRALFVISELQKRGVSRNLFAKAEGRGNSYDWGDNSTEEAKQPNRRVRVIIEKKKAIVPPPPPPPPPPEPNEGESSDVHIGKAGISWFLLILGIILFLIGFFTGLYPLCIVGIILALIGGLLGIILFILGILFKILIAIILLVLIVMGIRFLLNINFNLPLDAVKMLKIKGLTNAEIKEISNKHGGKGENKAIPKDNEKLKNFVEIEKEFVRGGYKTNLSLPPQDPRRQIAEYLDKNPKKREKLIQNLEDLRTGKKSLKYKNGHFLDFKPVSYITTDVKKELGVNVFPSNRREKDELGRHGCFRVADVAIAIKLNKLSPEDTISAKELAPKIYNGGKFTQDDLNKWNNIVDKTPKYDSDALTKHENHDGHTIDLVASGPLHSGSESGGLPHKGAHILIEDADNIIKNRR